MFKLLERLRGESEGYRKQIAVIAAFSLTAIIALAWLMSVSTGSHYSYVKTDSASSTSPLRAAWVAVADGFDSLRSTISSIGQPSAVIYTQGSTTTATAGE